jgi:hypothetical protein
MSALLFALLACRLPSEPTDPVVAVDPPADSDPPTLDSDPPTDAPVDPWAYWPPEDGTRPTCTPRELDWRAENAPRIDTYGGAIALAWHPRTGLRTWSGYEHLCTDAGGFGWSSIEQDDLTIDASRWNSATGGPVNGEFIIVDSNDLVWSRHGSGECINEKVSFVLGGVWLTLQGAIFEDEGWVEGCEPISIASHKYLPPPGPWIYNSLLYQYATSEPDHITGTTKPIPCILDTDGRLWCGPGDAPYLEPFRDPTRCWVEIAIDRYKACGIDGDGVVECHYVHQTVFPYGPPPPGLQISHLKMESEICGLDQDNIIRCWSTPGAQQLPPTDEPFVDFALAGNAGCGLRPDGTIRCWGDPTNPIVWLNPDASLPERQCRWP